MDEYLVVLRVVHIVTAAFWFGASVVFALFIEPTAATLGPGAAGFMSHLTQRRKLPVVIAVTSVIAILAGGLLFWRVSGGLDTGWLSSSHGAALTVGALGAIAAWLIGFLVMRPGIDRIGALARAVATGDTAARNEMTQLQARLRRAGLLNLSLLTLAVTAMAAARYL